MRNRRWAKILSERASGAARENRCARVRRIERGIATYDREIHDFVLLADPEVVRCLTDSPPTLLAPIPDSLAAAPAAGPGAVSGRAACRTGLIGTDRRPSCDTARMRARQIGSAALVAVALTGCISRNQGVALGGAASSMAGTMLLASNANEPDTMDGMDSTRAGAVLLVTGLLVLFTAAAMEEKRVEPKPVIVTIADASRVEAMARARSWQLTKAAYIAARGGNCWKVQQLADQVRDLDSDMLVTVMLRDVAVRRCVNPSDYDDSMPGQAPDREDPTELPPPIERLPSPAEAIPALPPGA